MADRLPKWAQELLDKHPGAEMPSRDNPIPSWLAQEAGKVPLWYVIREADQPRTQHPFLVHREIQREPGQWAEIVADGWPDVQSVADQMATRGVERVLVTGCGSAFFTAIYGQWAFQRIAGIPSWAVESFELSEYFPKGDASKTVVLGHSGTGGSIETVQAMKTSREMGCLTVAITNTEDTPVGRASDAQLTYVTRQECGPCISVVSTRLLLELMLAIQVADRLGRQVDPDLRDGLDRIESAGSEFLSREEEHVRKIASEHKDIESVFLVGSGPNYFSAREGTLKIEEQSILVGKAYRTGDFHHDALSLLGPSRWVIAIEASSAANDRLIDVLRASREAGAPTLAVTWSGTSHARELAAAADDVIELGGSLPEVLSPIPMTLVFQLLGYYLGVARGFNPDTLRTDYMPNARAWLTAFPLGTH
jgi:glucosamine--fructose-6-phosphate aminotransferase (isomerizing)